MIRSQRTSFIIALGLLLLESFIALCVHDGFVRPYVGDALVVMLLYFGVRSFSRLRPWPLAVGVLCFAFAVEMTQAAGLIHALGLSRNTLARLVLGNTFQWGDLVCYAVGTLAALGIDQGMQLVGAASRP